MSTDAVSEFFERERKQLGELSDELDLTETNHVVQTECESQLDELEVPECIKRWSVAFQQRIEEKDMAEKEKLAEMEEQGLKDLHEWAVQYRDSLARGKKLSRAHDKELLTARQENLAASSSLSQADAEEGALWDRVCQLCNFISSPNEEIGNINSITTNLKDNQKDLNRLRVLLLQLKSAPPVIQRNVRAR